MKNNFNFLPNNINRLLQSKCLFLNFKHAGYCNMKDYATASTRINFKTIIEDKQMLKSSYCMKRLGIYGRFRNVCQE